MDEEEFKEEFENLISKTPEDIGLHLDKLDEEFNPFDENEDQEEQNDFNNSKDDCL